MTPGLFASTDSLAIGALHWCRENGIAVPGDLAVMGYDNAEISRYGALALTTVNYAADEISRIGVERDHIVLDAGPFGFGTLAAHAHCDALAVAVAIVTPSRSRAITRNRSSPTRWLDGSSWSGIQRSTSLLGKAKSGGMTPITSRLRSSTWTVVPITSADPPSRVCHVS